MENQPNLMDMPPEIRQMIFKELSLKEACNVRCVSQQCRNDVDSFQTSIAELDDRKPQEIKKLSRMRFEKVVAVNLCRFPIQAGFFRNPEHIRQFIIEDISEDNLRVILKECRNLKQIRIRIPEDIGLETSNSFLLAVPFNYFYSNLDPSKQKALQKNSSKEAYIKSYMKYALWLLKECGVSPQSLNDRWCNLKQGRKRVGNRNCFRMGVLVYRNLTRYLQLSGFILKQH